jgi:hypothetical protein
MTDARGARLSRTPLKAPHRRPSYAALSFCLTGTGVLLSAFPAWNRESREVLTTHNSLCPEPPFWPRAGVCFECPALTQPWPLASPALAPSTELGRLSGVASMEQGTPRSRARLCPEPPFKVRERGFALNAPH